MLNKTIKTDDAIFKAMDLKTISRIICNTDKGFLTLQIRKGETNYYLCLDSVPLEKELNRELMELLFPAPKPMEVPQVVKDSIKDVGVKTLQDIGSFLSKETKKKGRPKGSKSGKKMN